MCQPMGPRIHLNAGLVGASGLRPLSTTLAPIATCHSTLLHLAVTSSKAIALMSAIFASDLNHCKLQALAAALKEAAHASICCPCACLMAFGSEALALLAANM